MERTLPNEKIITPGSKHKNGKILSEKLLPNKIIIIQLLKSARILPPISDINKVFLEANEALIAENYNDAIDKYESILNNGYESTELYYNLGNAYYRAEYIGKSIWAYKNALEISPRNSDIAHNLSIANTRIVDRIEMPKSFIFITIYSY